MKQYIIILLTILTLLTACSQATPNEVNSANSPVVTPTETTASTTAVTPTTTIPDPNQDQEREVKGMISFGFESSDFMPEKSKERWWLTGTKDLQTRYKSVAGNDYESVCAILKGIPSEPGQYGHLGAYQREFKVTEVIDVGKTACK